MAVHRIIEAKAAECGDVPAIAHADITLSYRQLNQRANSMARHLLAQGFRRGGVVTVCLPRHPETASLLLAVLKAGGTYVLMDPECASPHWPRGVSFAERIVDMTPEQDARTSCANLPIVARSTDIACVIADESGESIMLVPHATIMSLRRGSAPRLAEWSREAGALDLWAALMSGSTVTMSGAALRSAA